MATRSDWRAGDWVRWLSRVAGVVAGVALAVSAPSERAGAAETARVSVSSKGEQGDNDSYGPDISADGRYVVFTASATNLVSGDTNGWKDVFLHDRELHETTLISVSSSGVQGNNHSSHGGISADGRYVVFESDATNLVAGDVGGYSDVFVRDRQTGTTTRVSVSSTGAEGNNLSWEAMISGDGRYVVFQSAATNLVSDDGDDVVDIFVRDLLLNETTRVSLSNNGAPLSSGAILPSISGDGRYVTYQSIATNLVAGDTNAANDVFVYDRVLHLTERVSVSSMGAQASGASTDASISGGGRYVTFLSEAADLVAGDTNAKTDVFVHDRETGATTRVNLSNVGAQANDHSEFPRISVDGRAVVFHSDATNLVTGDSNATTDVFLYDRQSGVTSRVSVTSSGAQANGISNLATISGDGRRVVFQSDASTLVSDDTNGKYDVFVHDREAVTGVAGTVTLQGRTANMPPVGHSIAMVVVEGGPTAAVSQDGSFLLIGLGDGEHAIMAYAAGYLSATRTIVVLGGAVVDGLPPVHLPAGLVDSNNLVDIRDVVAIIAAYGTRPPARVDGLGRVVDINGDGVVSLPDLTLTLGNFGRVSPVVWP